MNKETWVVVANSCIARIYKKDFNTLSQIEVFEHPEGRLHNRDLVSDKPGRDFESVGSARHSMEPRHTPKENEAIIFVKELSNYLQKARNKGEFDRLYIAASPSILGLIRQNLDNSTAKLVEIELDKDLTQLKPEELISHFAFVHG